MILKLFSNLNDSMILVFLLLLREGVMDVCCVMLHCFLCLYLILYFDPNKDFLYISHLSCLIPSPPLPPTGF